MSSSNIIVIVHTIFLLTTVYSYICGIIQESATIKSNEENEVICTQIVIHFDNIQWCGTI